MNMYAKTPLPKPRALTATAVLLLCLWSAFGTAQDSCLSNEKVYKSDAFDSTDFLAADQGITVGEDLELSTEELDLENLVLGLEQPFYVDYLSEGAGASHLLGFFFLDIDTDKDGFPDFLESDDNSDLDGDGYVNSEDDDDDGDGILDVDDRAPVGITSMPASYFRNGTLAANRSLSGKGGNPDYWQFVPNSVITEGTYAGYFEMPGTYLYIDNNNNSVPDVLEDVDNRLPPYTTDKGTATKLITNSSGSMLGLLGNDWTYEGTPGTTTADKYHWTGSTIFYIADDDGDAWQDGSYTDYLPYRNGSGPAYKDVISTTDGNVDYLIYGTTDPEDDRIPSVLIDEDGDGNRTFKLDARGQQMYKYRWYKSNISGAREIVFFLSVFYNSGGRRVNTYYSKSAFNPDTAPNSPNRNGATNGDYFGRDTVNYTNWRRNNWFPELDNVSDHDGLVYAVWGLDKWTDIASIPGPGGSPVLNTGGALKDPRVTQAWVDEWENFTNSRRILQYRALADWFSETAVNANDLIQGRYAIDMSLEGDSSVIRAYENQMVHLMVGAPSATKDAWLLGWEDLYNGGDRDYEDVVFYVKRAAGGELVSLNVADDIGIGASSDAEFSLSQVSFAFSDNFTDDKWGTQGRYIAYFYRLSQTDEWTALLGDEPPGNNHHLRTVDKFQPAYGGSTVVQADGSVLRTVTLPVEDKKTELYWKVQMASENVDAVFQPKVHSAEVGYQSLVHDFYYNSAVIPNSDINYIAAHESPLYSWNELRNRGHLYAFQSFIHGTTITLTKVGDGDSPENTPTSQPVAMFQKDADSAAINLFKWDAGVSMLNDLEDSSTARTIYSYVADNNATLATGLSDKRVTLDPNATALTPELISAFELTSNKTTANVWVDNYHHPSADERDENAAAIWLINWIHGFENPVISDDGVVSTAETREWVLGGINRASPLVIRPPGRPIWLDRSSAISVTDKRTYLAFAEAKADDPTRLLIGTESGMVHAIDAGQWVGEPKVDPVTNEVYTWAEGHYKDDNYGTGKEVWAILPGHLLPDIKYNYTGADDVVAKCDATAVATIVKDGNTWRRVAVFTQGYKAGSQTVGGNTRVGNVVWAMDLTDVDDPKPLWHRSDAAMQDLINPVSMGWLKHGSSPVWVTVYPSGGTPVSGQVPSFNIVNAVTGDLVKSVAVGSPGKAGTQTMLGTPALLDTDGDGYIDHVFGATSEGYLYAYDTVNQVTRSVELSGTFYLAPNIDLDGDGNVKVVAVTGDSPLIYDSQAKPFVNKVYYYKYVVSGATWESQGTIDLPTNHNVFSRPKLVGTQLVVGTTTGDTFNFCDADPDDPGALLLYDLNQIGTEDVLDYEIEDFGSVLAPIVVSDGRVLAHRTSYDADDPTEQGSVLANRQLPSPEALQSFSIADIFGVASWQDDLVQTLKTTAPPEPDEP